MADDIFKQFGGRTLSPSKEEKQKPAPDPFAQFGGKKVAAPSEEMALTVKPEDRKQDPFKQFGGKEVSRDAIQTEIEDRSFFDKPILGAEYTKQSEIEQIAQKHGVDPRELESLAPYFGARMEDKSFASPEEFKRAAGGVGQILLNLPQKAYKKYRGGEMEKALDELQNLAAGRQSYTQFAGEVIAPLPIVAGKAASLGGKVLGGAATGAVAGYGTSSKEQELPATLAGAALGGALSGVAGKLGQRVQKTKVPQAEKEMASQFLAKNAGDIEDGTQALLAKRVESEKSIREVLAGKELSQEQAEIVVKQQIEPDSVSKLLDEATEEGKLYQGSLEKAQSEQSDLQQSLDRLGDQYYSVVKRLMSTGDSQISITPAARKLQTYSSQHKKELDRISELLKQKKAKNRLLDKDKRIVEAKYRGGSPADLIRKQKALDTLDKKEVEVFERYNDLIRTSNKKLNTLTALLDSSQKDYTDILRKNKYTDLASQAEEALSTRINIIKEKLSQLEMPKEGVTREALIRKLADDVAETRARSFAEELTGESVKNLKEARKAISEYASRQGNEATLKRYKIFTEEKAALDHIHQKAIRIGRGDNFKDKALNWLSDAQFVLRDIDERFQVNLEPIHRKMNAASNRMSFARNSMRANITDIYNKNKGIDNELVEGGRVYKALDSGDTSGLSPEELSAYTDFKKFFNDSLDYVNRLVREKDPSISPLSIPPRDDYVPHILLSPEDLSGKFERVYKLALGEVSESLDRNVSDLAQLSPKEFSETLAGSDALKELVKGIKLFDSKPIKSGQELVARMKDLLQSREGRRKMETVAKAALERGGEVPIWMRETDLYKLADRWTSNTLKHLYLRGTMDEMRSISKRIAAAGGDLESEYVNTLLQDISGTRKGTAKDWMLQGRVQYQNTIDKAVEGKGVAGRAVGAVAKALPEIFSDLNRQIYPNLLGLSPRALIMNSTQLWAKTAPELGSEYGYGAVFRGSLNATANLGKYLQKMEDLGFAPADYVRKYSRPMAEGIRRNALYAIPNEALNTMGDASMFLYTKLDALNRAVALATADVMAQDLVKGSKMARKALNKMPASLRREVNAAKSQEEIANAIGSHLNAATQYNYNTISLSQFGRTMGPFFSTFSKWPTATAGEIIQDLRNKGAIKATMRNMDKFLVPLILMQAGDILMTGYDPERPWQENQAEKTDRNKKLFGQYGLSQSSPIGAAQSIITGEVFTPPAVDAVIKSFVIPALEQDSGQLVRGVNSAIQNFGPGSVFVRLLTDDLLTLVTGERPEGSTFIERTAEGTRRIVEGK